MQRCVEEESPAKISGVAPISPSRVAYEMAARVWKMMKREGQAVLASLRRANASTMVFSRMSSGNRGTQ